MVCDNIQICDILLYSEYVHQQIVWEEIQQIMKNVNLNWTVCIFVVIEFGKPSMEEFLRRVPALRIIQFTKKRKRNKAKELRM